MTGHSDTASSDSASWGTSPADALVVTTITAPDEALALRIGRELVQRHLAACAQVGGPVRSVYRWEGAVEEQLEWVVTAKTISGRLPALEAAVRSMHPYDLPEVVALPVVGGSGGYLSWVAAESCG
jgi:periplasmic divalent cation tolerance protein